MTTQEFSSEFDVLYNNIMSNQAPGLDEYEKSVFLTKGQLEILNNHFNAKGNKFNEGFDQNRKRQIDFSKLVRVTTATPLSGTAYAKMDENSKLFQLPNDILYVLNEVVSIGLITTIPVVPISLDEYFRLMSRPYKKPLKNQVWRLLQSGSSDLISEIITGPNTNIISKYKVRYIKRPKPIVLVNLRDDYPGVTIDGYNTITQCELDPILHTEVLQRAVELAKMAYTGNVQGVVELGQRAE